MVKIRNHWHPHSYIRTRTTYLGVTNTRCGGELPRCALHGGVASRSLSDSCPILISNVEHPATSAGVERRSRGAVERCQNAHCNPAERSVNSGRTGRSRRVWASGGGGHGKQSQS